MFLNTTVYISCLYSNPAVSSFAQFLRSPLQVLESLSTTHPFWCHLPLLSNKILCVSATGLFMPPTIPQIVSILPFIFAGFFPPTWDDFLHLEQKLYILHPLNNKSPWWHFGIILAHDCLTIIWKSKICINNFC